MVYNNKPQYNNNYPKKNFSNSTDSNGGTAKITSTKKSGCILEVNLNNQNLVLKGFWDIEMGVGNCFLIMIRQKQIQLLINHKHLLIKWTISCHSLKKIGVNLVLIQMSTSNR